MRNWINLFEKADFVTSFKMNSLYAKGDFEVFRNLSAAEVNKFYDGGTRMFLLPDSNVIFWSEAILHSDMANALKISEDCPHLFFNSDRPKEIWWNEIERYKKEEAWDLDRLNFRNDVKYYDANLRKDWEAVKTNPNLAKLCGGSFKVVGVDEEYEFVMNDGWMGRNVDA